MIKLLLHESKRRIGSPGVFITPGTYFILVTFCDMLAGIEVSFWTDGTGTTDGWTDRRGSRNSYLDDC